MIEVRVATNHPDLSERKTDRLEAFSDAVLAIAITLPIAEIKLPEVGPNADLLVELAKLWPSYLTTTVRLSVSASAASRGKIDS